MYLIYFLSILIFVYGLPALACMPKLVYSPLTAFSIPIFSTLVIYIISTLLITVGLFQPNMVLLVTIGLASVAAIRLTLLLKSKPLSWSLLDKKIYLFQAIILLPYLIKLGTHGFDRGDEIYSWNFWAIQHVFNESIDFSHTGAPYPQLLPKLLAYCYQLLRNIELQLPVKATLIVFPFALLTAMAMVFRQYMAKSALVYILILALVLWGIGLAQFFDDGYADPIMTSALIVSVALFWLSQHRLSAASPYFAGLAVLAAIVCAHAKQAGLLWTVWALPLLLVFAYQREKDKRYLFLGVFSLLGAIIWLMTEGAMFHHNEGVLILSFEERGIVKQFLHSVNKYLIHQPLLLCLLVYAGWVSQKNKLLKPMFYFFLIPAWICWFLFGAYQLRLGQHLIAFAWFMVVASGCMLPNLSKWAQFKTYCTVNQKAIFSGLLGFSVMISATLFVKEIYVAKKDVSLYEGGRHCLQRYFGKDADFIYQTLYSQPDKLLWVPTRYIYGLFYKHTQLTLPDYHVHVPYRKMDLIDELRRKSPDYVFTVSSAVIDGPASGLLDEVIQECPLAFKKVTGSQNRFSFVTYMVNKSTLQNDPCLIALREENRFPMASQLLLAPSKEGKIHGS